MNIYLNQQILNAIMFNQNFILNCKAAAIKDDGAIDKEEAKKLKKLEAAAKKYIAELQSIQ